jgi:hypothetical protein
MVNRQVRLEPSALEILGKYAENPSEAVRVMHLKILGVKPVGQTWAVDGIQGSLNFDATYWKKVSETVDSCIERAKRY